MGGLKEIRDSSDFNSEIKKPILTVAKYYADWCGPCRQIAPFVDQLARKYPKVNFVQVSDKCEVVHERGVSAFPTFQFYVSGRMVSEMKGANPSELEQRVIQFKVEPVESFAGKGFKLDSASTSSSESGDAASMREARLKAYQATARQVPSEHKSSEHKSVPMQVSEDAVSKDEEDDVERAIALSMQESKLSSEETKAKASSSSSVSESKEKDDKNKRDLAEKEDEEEQRREEQLWDEEMVPVPVNEELLRELLDMGFSDTRARKGLVHGHTLEGALQWISEHEDDADIDQPYMVKRSDAQQKQPLTEEEKEKRMLQVKEKIRLRKEQKAREEKEAEIKRERERRERGKNTGEIQEERDRMMRKREAEKQKKEKQDAEKEKKRLLAEIARDKEIRKMNKGVLPSVLGVDGYNPSAVQYDGKTDLPPTASESNKTPAPAPVAVAVATTSSSSSGPAQKKANLSKGNDLSTATLTLEEKQTRIETAIQTLSRYRTAGDGGQALKLLLTFVKNINDQPNEPKYRSINTESNAFKTKLAPLIGSLAILKLLGFLRSEEDETKLKLEGDIDADLFASTTLKLTQAETLYKKMNP